MAEAIYGVGVDEVIQIQAVLEPADASNRQMTWTSDNEYYAIVRGKSIQPDVVGKHWGSTIIRGVTEDGGDVVVTFGALDVPAAKRDKFRFTIYKYTTTAAASLTYGTTVGMSVGMTSAYQGTSEEVTD